VAEQLHICRNTYSDIELGKTDIHLSRLAQIANFFGVDIGHLVDDEKTVFYLSGTGTQNAQFHKGQCNEYHVHATEDKSLQHELEKAQLTIAHLRQEVADKQKIINVLEAVNANQSIL
jgi:transcriptional regulator with XRE-family HTH domain